MNEPQTTIPLGKLLLFALLFMLIFRLIPIIIDVTAFWIWPAIAPVVSPITRVVPAPVLIILLPFALAVIIILLSRPRIKPDKRV